jgi:hypothetical protein
VSQVRRSRVFHLIAAVTCALLVGPACGADGLLFRKDQRVRIEVPARNEKVRLPLTVTWGLRDPADATGIGSYAVFFDNDPQPPGKTLAHFARNDRACERTPGCPDLDYFAQRNIFVTEQPRLTIERLRPAPGVNLSRGERDRHEVTVIVLDREGKRASEASWSRPFEVVT